MRFNGRDGRRWRDAAGGLAALASGPVWAAYFVLALYAENQAEQIDTLPVVSSLFIAVLCSTLVSLGALALLRRTYHAGTTTVVVVIFVFAYGYVRDGLGVSGQAPFLPIWMLAFGTAMALVVLGRRTVGRASLGFAVLGSILVCITLVQIGVYRASSDVSFAEARERSAPTHHPSRSDLPDIYFLVPDRYPSEPILDTSFDFDNSAFLEQLEERGFYIAHDSRANYLKTALSLAAALNADYLDLDRLERDAATSGDWGPVHGVLKGQLVVPSFLQDLGYEYISIPSWYEPAAGGWGVDEEYRFDGVSLFTSVLYGSTLLADLLPVIGVDIQADFRDIARAHTLHQFARLQEVAGREGPKFVFAHILVPHEPFVFDVDGGYVSDETERSRGLDENFVRQLQYTNGRLLEAADTILAEAPGPDPILIIQADEGPYIEGAAHNREFKWLEAPDHVLRRKFGILTALRLPGNHDPPLYPELSPVNTFRVILGSYFGADLPLLPDRSFAFPDERRLYEAVDVTSRAK